MGICALQYNVPALRLRRFKELANSDSSIFQALYQQSMIQAQMDQLEELLFNVAPGGDKTLLKNHWAKLLHASVDGRHLKDTRKAGASYHWVEHGAHIISGSDYIKMIHTRIGALPTRSRCGRGRAVNKQCRACNRRNRPGLIAPCETLYHVVQECGRTHGGRILRHDKICNIIGEELSSKGWQVVKEPIVHTSEGNKKPDLVCTKGPKLVVVDANVVASSAIQTAFVQKQHKYGSAATMESINQRFGGAGVEAVVLPVTITWRGIVNPSSWRGLLDMGVTRKVINTAARYALYGTYLSFKRFMETTR